MRNGTRNRAFTLTEVMIAMGILVVGMAMVAGAFYAGIQSHTTTIDDITRTMVGQNAMAIAKARLRYPNSGIGLALAPLAVGRDDQKFPVGMDSGHGYLMLARQLRVGQNDYEFIVIPYATQAPHHIVGTTQVDNALISDTADGVSQVRVFGRGAIRKLDVDVKIVEYDEDKQEMAIATVVEKVGSSAVLLDKRITTGTRNLTVIEVTDEAGNPVDAMPEFGGVYRERTVLRLSR